MPFVIAAALSMVTLAVAAQTTSTKRHYPAAHRDTTVDTYFGHRIAAPYQWMEDRENPKLHRWVKQENRLTDQYLARIPYRSRMRKRLKQLWDHARETAPVRAGEGMLFYRRNSGLQKQSVLYVRTSRTARPRVLLDPNKLSPDGSVQLKFGQPSPTGKYYAYALSKGGSDWETIHVLDTTTGKPLGDVVKWVKFSHVSWTRDGKGFFYSRFPNPHGDAGDAASRGQMVYYHKLGTPQDHDRLILARPDLPHAFLLGADFVGGNVNRDGRYFLILVQTGAARHDQLYYMDLGDPDHPNLAAPVKPLYTGGHAGYYPVGHIGDTLYLWTTRDTPRGKIVATKFDDPDPAHWRTVVPESNGVIVDADIADGHILVDYQVVATSRLKLFDTRGKLLDEVELPGDLGAVSDLHASPSHAGVYFSFSSYLFPDRVVRYDADSHETATFFKPQVTFDRSRYRTRQVFYRSSDGTRVPMFIVSAKTLARDGTHPAVLYGYGGFAFSTAPKFDPVVALWLQMGGVYAVAGIRGGGEYGEPWHQAGMLGNKQNVFDDFASAARYLVKHGYTSSSHLGIQGYSNGGLLTGASITQHPKLFGAAYIGHGLLDMLRYQKFTAGAFWTTEYGSSDKKADFQWLVKYSPLENIHADTCYPPTLLTTSWDDDRVVPSHEFKFTARMQHLQACDHPILLRTTDRTSHSYMPVDKRIRQDVDVWAFEAWNLGIRSLPVAATPAQ